MTAEDFVDRNEILPLMGTVKRAGEWMMGMCPCHSDGAKHHGKPGGESLGLSDAGVLKCFAGCSFKDIIATLRGTGYRQPQQQPSPIRRNAPDEMVRLYEYRDLAGTVVAEKARFETGDGRKSFKWRLPGAEGWPSPSGVSIADLPLFGAGRVAGTDGPVFYVEGEKACEACQAAELVAVTHGGGAGTKDFGDSLTVLTGRDVYLWADNDAPGRAYMRLVEARLQPIARTIRYVSVALPEKGDAFDYFARGGTVQDIESSSPSDPAVHVLAEDSVQVVVPTMAGPATVTFSEMEKRSRDFEAEVEVTCFQSKIRPYRQRMNLLSSSARTELRRDLEAIYGKDYGWTQVLNTALALATDSYLAQDRGIDVFDIPDSTGELLLIPPLLVADGATIIFGDGSSGKSYIVFRMAVCMALGVSFCGIKVPGLIPMVIDYEDSAANFKRRVRRLLRGMDVGDDLMGIHYWPARGIPLKDQVDAIRRKCQKDGIGIIIVDSIAPACGGKPEDADSALDMFRAIKKIGLPAILIAHVNRAGDTMKPFGSGFWHNEARRTWFVSRVQDEDSDELDIGFYCRKVNDGRRPVPMAFHVSFSPDEYGPVRVSRESMERVPELLDQASANSQVWAQLGNGATRTINEMVESTTLKYDAIEKALTRGPFVVVGQRESTKKGGRPANVWGRREDRYTDSRNTTNN